MKIWIFTNPESIGYEGYNNVEVIDVISKIRPPDVVLENDGTYVNMIIENRLVCSPTVYHGKDYWIEGVYDDVIEKIYKLAILEQLNKEVLK